MNTKRNVNLYLEANPNPNSLKFVADIMLVPAGQTFDYPNIESADEAPLAQKLFMFDFVDRVFFMNNFVTVTKKDSVQWIEVQDTIKRLIKEYINGGHPMLLANQTAGPASEDISETEFKIRSILEDYVKPAVEQDGGAIAFHSYNDGVVRVLLQGSCSGCPSATYTLKAGIENLLKKMIPEVKAVEAVPV